MTVRFAIAAVIAHHRRLDQTGAVGVHAVRQEQQPVAGMQPRRRLGTNGLTARDDAARDDLANDRPQLLFGHSCMSTASTMPITAASTGAPFRPSALPAARPSITTITRS